MKRRPTPAWARIILLGSSLLVLGAALLYNKTRPLPGPETLLLPGAAPQTFDYPFRLRHAPRTKFILEQTLLLPRLHPAIFVFYPQDFLWAVSVNGHPVHSPSLPLSAASCEGRSIDLAPYLHPGANEIELQLEARWGDARFRLVVSPWDKTNLILLALVLAATSGAALFACQLFQMARWEATILLAGIALRIIYCCGTPYFVRSFDYWGHAEYLDYVTQHLRLPPPNANWEAFQPPLYYILTGGVTRLLLALGLASDQRYILWQGISLLFSCGVLLAGCRIAGLLYEKADSRRLYLLAVLAVAPPLVFNAARVSNDSLMALLSFAWLALLLRYWHRPTRAAWIALSLVVALALLTKATALALALISLACLAFDRRLDPRAQARLRLTRVALLAAISTVIAGWYYIPRALHASALDTYVVGNLHSLSYQARIDNVLLKSLIFNPFKVVRYPFAETWGPRNDYFLEVFFKTMLLGEWIRGLFYKPLVRFIMLVALLLIPAFLRGLYAALKQRGPHDAPLLATLVGVFLAQWLYLQLAPYLSTQDFRFSVLLLMPVTYYLLHGVDVLPHHIKSAVTFLFQVALLNSAIYLMVLALGN